MTDIVPLALILFGVVIFLGFIGRMIFEETKIPEVVWLMILGLLIGYSGAVDTEMMLTTAPIFAALALAIILFEGGLNMDFYKVMSQFSRASSLAILNLIFSIIFIAAASVIIFALFGESLGVYEWGWLYGILLGTIVGGSSSAIVIPIVRGLEIREKIITFLSLESAITDALCVVSAIAVLELIAAVSAGGPGIAPDAFAHNILSAFSIGAFIGIAAGIGWLYVSRLIKKVPATHRLDLAVVFLIYGLVEFVGGSGAISVLFFGIVLGNGDAIAKIIKTRKKLEICPGTVTFQMEVIFFVRTFFFVFLGMLVTIKIVEMLIIGIILGILLLAARIIPVYLSSMKTDITRNEQKFILTMAPRGLAAAVLAQLPSFPAYNIPNASVFSDLVFVIIMISIMISVAGVLLSSRQKGDEKPGNNSKEVKIEKQNKN